MSDVDVSPSCPYEGQREVRSRYLAGRLPESEAVEFEKHYFACPLCAEAVEVGAKLRSALGRDHVSAAATATRAPRTWLPLAAAAALALAAVGVWQLARRAPESARTPVLRSQAAAPLEVRIARDDKGALVLSWAPLPGAATYVVHVFAADGSSVWTSEGGEPRRTIDAAALASAPPGAALSAQVEALDAMRRVVAASDLTAIQPRR